MIINLLINLFLLIFGSLFVFLPEVTISSIPFIGSYISDALVLMVVYWNSFVDVFPYAEIVFHTFLTIILPFELLLIVAKFFLGHRVPVNHVN